MKVSKDATESRYCLVVIDLMAYCLVGCSQHTSQVTAWSARTLSLTTNLNHVDQHAISYSWSVSVCDILIDSCLKAKFHYTTHTHNRFTDLFNFVPDYLSEPAPER